MMDKYLKSIDRSLKSIAESLKKIANKDDTELTIDEMKIVGFVKELKEDND